MTRVRKRTLAILAVALGAMLPLASATTAGADVPETELVAAPFPEGMVDVPLDGSVPFYDADGNPIDPPSPAEQDLQQPTARLGCTPVTLTDNPHKSSWSTGPAVQAHGSWEKGSCTASLAHVESCLYQYMLNTSTGTMGLVKWSCAVAQIGPGGGSGNRTTSHVDCGHLRQTGWTAVTDVDVDGQVDSGEVDQKSANVFCGVDL